MKSSGWLWTFALSTAVTSARAEVDTAHRLVYDVPDGQGCTSEAEFETGIEQEVGRTLFDPAAPNRVEVTASKAERGWSVALRIVDEFGDVSAERSFSTSGGDCNTVISGARLSLALLLDRAEQAPGAPEPTAAAVNPLPDASDPPPEVSEPAGGALVSAEPAGGALEMDGPVAVGPAPSPRWELSIGGLSYLGVVQEFTFGFGAELGHAFEMGIGLQLGAALTQSTTQTREVEQTPVRLAMSLDHLGFGVSYDLHRNSTWRHGVGLVGHYGRLHLGVDGARRVGDGTARWAAVGLRGTSRVMVWEPFAVVGGAELLTPLLESQFTEVDGTVLAELSPVGGLVFLRIGAVW